MRFVTAVYATLCLTVLALSAQDLVRVAPQAAKVEYEDARIRVVRLRIPAGATLPMHDRPARVVIPLTPGDVTTTRPDGTTSRVRTRTGNVAWSEPTHRSVTNLDGDLENVIVEFKTAAGPARPLARPPSPQPAAYLADRFHHWLFENQYLRVYDVRIPPGATTDFHLHALDSVFVGISGGLTAEQPQGQLWKQPEKSQPGSVEFSADAQRPRTHRVRNEGTTEYQVVIVQLLQ